MDCNFALVVIDMQADYIGAASKRDCYSDDLIERINERINQVSSSGGLVVYVRNKGRRNKQDYVSPFAEGLSVVSDFVFEKGRASVFDNENFVTLLGEKAIGKIEVVGIDGNCCVASSAAEAAVRGFSVGFPLSYIGIKDLQRFERTKEKLNKNGVEIQE